MGSEMCIRDRWYPVEDDTTLFQRVALVARKLWAKPRSPRADGFFAKTVVEHLRPSKTDSCACGTPVASNRWYPVEAGHWTADWPSAPRADVIGLFAF